MIQKKTFHAIGLMSGTSLDGIDVAWIHTDGHEFVERIAFESMAYSLEDSNIIRSALGKRTRDEIVDRAEQTVTNRHIEAIHHFLSKLNVLPQSFDVIGFHGHTLLHDPANHFTWQIGDGGRLAIETGIDVVCDMRKADVLAGGQGAPLLPLYHKALASSLVKPVLIVNIGGVSNITWLGDLGTILAFDCGPGNALLDDYVMARTGMRFDKAGEISSRGRVESQLLSQWLKDPYFMKTPPKSLDRDAWDVSGLQDSQTENGAATLSEFTVQSIKQAVDLCPSKPTICYVSGGGRYNLHIMARLREVLDIPVYSVDDAGWDGDSIEAEGFAYLAVRSLLGLPLSMPGTTGVHTPQNGGVLHRK